MNPSAKAGTLAAITAAVSAGILAALFHSWREAESLAAVVAFFAVLAGAISFAFTYRLCKSRFGTSQPVLGAIRGSALALATFVACTIPHAIFFPGAQGVLASLVGQLLIAGLSLGVLVVALGAGVGVMAERLFLAPAPNPSFKGDALKRAP